MWRRVVGEREGGGSVSGRGRSEATKGPLTFLCEGFILKKESLNKRGTHTLIQLVDKKRRSFG